MIFLLVLLIAGLSIGCERVVLTFDGSSGGGSDGVGGDPDSMQHVPLVIQGKVNLSLENTGDRTCSDGGDMVSYRALSLVGNKMDLETAPSSNCLVPGDEVVLINLQGSEDAFEAVGRHELLLVESIVNDKVNFSFAPQLDYGASADGALDHQQVVIQRVPSYFRLVVEPGAEVTALRWQDQGGTGVFALRVLGEIQLDGVIDMSGAGYRGGVQRDEPLMGGVQGESIAGPGRESQTANRGGGGGGQGDQTTEACVQDGNAGGGGAHLEDGQDARVNDSCDGSGRGRKGASYAALGRLFLGSGGGSGGVDNIRADNPPGAAGGEGGGVIWLLSQSIVGSGSILSRGSSGIGDEAGVECELGFSVSDCYDHSGAGGAGAGGTVRLSTVQWSGPQVDVAGGLGGNGYDQAGGDGGDGADGVFQLD